MTERCRNCGGPPPLTERPSTQDHGWCYSCAGNERILNAIQNENDRPSEEDRMWAIWSRANAAINAALMKRMGRAG